MRLAATFMISIAIGLSGCSSFPAGSAKKRDITSEVAQAASGIAFYSVTRALIPSVTAWPKVNQERSSGWIADHHGPLGAVIRAGDTIDLTIWDTDTSSILTGGLQNQVQMPGLVVSPRGQVFLPYVGSVTISGMSPERARTVLQNRVIEISSTAQVQLRLSSGRQNMADLISGVARPGTYPLPDGNFSVLTLISTGGGVDSKLRNPRVKLQRGHNLYAISLKKLYANPRLDTVLRGGDKVFVEEDDRFFLSLGATGRENVFYFEQDDLSALTAISMIGGITDSRADPEGILILREYPRSALAAGQRGPREQQVVFAIDLTSADGLFAAKNLHIQPGDVVYATESPVTSLRLAIGIIGSGFGLVNTANTSLGN